MAQVVERYFREVEAASSSLVTPMLRARIFRAFYILYLVIKAGTERKNMWSRVELKGRAKWVMNQCYWKAVLVSLVLFIAAGSAALETGSRLSRHFVIDSKIFAGGNTEVLFFLITSLLTFSVFSYFIDLILDIFLFQPLEVNAKRFFIISREQPAELNELGFSFKHGYMNVVKIQLFRSLYIILWTMLFIIPGFIKSYEYYMVPYILAENPNLDSKEVFRISRDMMYGEKWNAFVLDLSFFGWYVLSMFTCGILSVFFVNPYKYLTYTELYYTLKCKLFGNYGNGGNRART